MGFHAAKKESNFVRFGEIISRDDPYHRLLSIHNGFKFFNHTLPWITHASIQNGCAVEEPGRAQLYRDPYVWGGAFAGIASPLVVASKLLTSSGCVTI